MSLVTPFFPLDGPSQPQVKSQNISSRECDLEQFTASSPERKSRDFLKAGSPIAAILGFSAEVVLTGASFLSFSPPSPSPPFFSPALL